MPPRSLQLPSGRCLGCNSAPWHGWALSGFCPSSRSCLPGKDGTKEEKTLDRFAWNSYLQYCGPVGETLPATRKRYLMAIKALQKGDAAVGGNDRTLASHLMQYYGHGVIELDDELLVQFFASASIKLRAQAVGDIGWNLIQEGAFLSPEMQAGSCASGRAGWNCSRPPRKRRLRN